jgi:NDP-sugar pyrophosphorylase family protein
MRAMIFAAGLGTRLRPLTNNKPKALVEVDGMPLLEIAIRRLKYFGCRDIVINIHHFGDLILQFLEDKRHFDINIMVSDERDLLLNTGGGLKKARPFLEDAPFLVYNTDIITNMDLKTIYQKHIINGSIATLATRDRSTSRYLLFNEDHRLVGWTNVKTGELKLPVPSTEYRQRAFSGIHVLSPKIFDFMPKEEVFSIIDVYLNIAADQLILEYPHDEDQWIDVGKIPELERAAKFLKGIKLN